MSRVFDPKVATAVHRIASFRTAGLAAALAAPLLLGPNLIAAQEQLTPPSEMRYGRARIAAPIGHRQPRAADIPQSAKAAADLLDERETAHLNRKLMICRGC